MALSALVAAGATRALDRKVLDAAQAAATPALDVAASLITILGQTEVAGVIALALAVAWWRREGVGGLVPLLLFAGVLLELAMKYLLPHPGPPRELSRELELLPFLRSASPYSYPSGHLLRTTFLAGVIGARAPRWATRGLWAIVVAMALTRVYLGAHWLSDVVGGILLGLLLVAIAASLRRPRERSARAALSHTRRDATRH